MMQGVSMGLGVLLFAVCAGLVVLVLVLAAIIARNARRTEPFLNTFNSAPVGLVHVGMDSSWLRMNDKMLEITGYTREELVGKSFADITVDDDMPENEEKNRRLIAGEIDSYVLEKRYRRKDKRIIWVKISVNLVRTRTGEPDYYVSTVEDIDDLKRAEHALLEQQARFRAFWDNSPFNQSLKDPQGRLVEVNRAYQETYGLPNENVRGRTLTEAHGTEWGSHVDDFDREVLRTRQTRTADVQVPGKDGDPLTIRVTKFPVYDRENHVVGVGGISFDITSQVRAAREVRESEERFRATFEQAAVGIAHIDIDGNWLRVNRRYCDIVGYPEDELRRQSFRDFTHPDDLKAELGQRDALVAGDIDILSIEKRYIRKDGTPIWVHVTASMTHPAKDQDPYLIVVIE
ncbi:MAG: PAS domain S-box protein, partial [Alphaproteobacteria bacterium]|nr:PAS domain S-box protein [Alphaproteobacteria bacterium]